MMSSDATVEDLLAQLGTSGKYQMRQHVLHCIVAFLSGMHMFSLTFIAPTPPHRCQIPDLDLAINNSGMTNMSVLFDKAILSQYIPLNSEGELDSCRRYKASPFDNRSSDDKMLEVGCNGHFVYDTSIYQQSRVYDFGLVCENKWKRAFIQSIYVFGVFNGGLFCGGLADRFGRKIVLCVSGVLQLTFALIQPHVTNFLLYCVSLFFYGMFGSAGAYVTAFVLAMELVHKSNRAYCGAIFNSSFAVGACFVAIYGYLIRDIVVLQTVYALHAVVLLPYWWLLDESIRFLYSQGRISESIKIAKNAVRLNGGSFTSNYKISENNSRFKSQQSFVLSGLADLLRFPMMRCRAVIMAFNWFAISLCFYGLAFNTGRLPGNPYLVFLISAAADLPGFFLVVLLVNKTGRRSLNAIFLFIGGGLCIITTLIPRGLLVTTLALLAKVCLASCFTIVYYFTAELFPTVIRNSALGFGTMSSRLGGTLTPQISLLTFFDKSIPPLLFGGVAICASFAGLFLPETLNKELPQTLKDGEDFGRNDTAFTTCCTKSKEKDEEAEVNETILVDR